MAEAGARFETYVRSAMTEAEIASMAELGRRSGIAAPIWYSWFRGEKQPRRMSLTLAGQALERTPEQLLSVWDGERPHKARRATESPDDLVSALRDQTAALNALVAQLDTFVGPLGEVVADLLRDRVRAATDRTRSGAPTS